MKRIMVDRPLTTDTVLDQTLVGQTLALGQGGKCALVGSSGRLLDHKYGAEIDKADIVMRFNYAPVQGYEQYVGSKTTILAVGQVSEHKEKMISRALDLNATLMVLNHHK